MGGRLHILTYTSHWGKVKTFVNLLLIILLLCMFRPAVFVSCGAAIFSLCFVDTFTIVRRDRRCHFQAGRGMLTPGPTGVAGVTKERPEPG